MYCYDLLGIYLEMSGPLMPHLTTRFSLSEGSTNVQLGKVHTIQVRYNTITDGDGFVSLESTGQRVGGDVEGLKTRGTGTARARHANSSAYTSILHSTNKKS